MTNIGYSVLVTRNSMEFSGALLLARLRVQGPLVKINVLFFWKSRP
jgi:hypothetical protein